MPFFRRGRRHPSAGVPTSSGGMTNFGSGSDFGFALFCFAGLEITSRCFGSGGFSSAIREGSSGICSAARRAISGWAEAESSRLSRISALAANRPAASSPSAKLTNLPRAITGIVHDGRPWRYSFSSRAAASSSWRAASAWPSRPIRSSSFSASSRRAPAACSACSAASCFVLSLRRGARVGLGGRAPRLAGSGIDLLDGAGKLLPRICSVAPAPGSPLT